MPTKKMYETGVAHPAVFSSGVLCAVVELLEELHQRILDPFAGTGGVHKLRDILSWDVDTVGIELEPEWSDLHPDTLVGDALDLPFAAGSFDAIVTSPTYGNRMADHHNARDGSVRRSYTHDLGRTLSLTNSGVMQWGGRYRDFHRSAWTEAERVLRPGGRLVLNISDHIRQNQRQYVASWHTQTLLDFGFVLADSARVVTPRMRAGAYSRARVPSELVLAFDKITIPLSETTWD